MKRNEQLSNPKTINSLFFPVISISNSNIYTLHVGNRYMHRIIAHNPCQNRPTFLFRLSISSDFIADILNILILRVRVEKKKGTILTRHKGNMRVTEVNLGSDITWMVVLKESQGDLMHKTVCGSCVYICWVVARIVNSPPEPKRALSLLVRHSLSLMSSLPVNWGEVHVFTSQGCYSLPKRLIETATPSKGSFTAFEVAW